MCSVMKLKFNILTKSNIYILELMLRVPKQKSKHLVK